MADWRLLAEECLKDEPSASAKQAALLVEWCKWPNPIETTLTLYEGDKKLAKLVRSSPNHG